MPWPLRRALPRLRHHPGDELAHIHDVCAFMGGVLTEPLVLPLLKGATVHLSPGDPRPLNVFLAVSLTTTGEGRPCFLAQG